MISTLIFAALLLSNINLSYQQTCTSLANTASDASYFAVFSKVASAGDCCTICNNNPNCQFYTFSSCNDATLGNCYLKSTVGRTYSKSFRTSGYRSTETTVAPTVATTTRAAICVESADTNYPGNDIPNQGFGSVASSTDCCNLCGANPSCTAYSYSPADKYCWIKNPRKLYYLIEDH